MLHLAGLLPCVENLKCKHEASFLFLPAMCPTHEYNFTALTALEIHLFFSKLAILRLLLNRGSYAKK